jgi:hypothetical protein
MNSRFNFLRMLFVFILLALPLAGCDNPPWEAGMVLVLKVDAPNDGATVTTPSVTVTGRVKGSSSAGALVKINDAPEIPVKDGKFSADVTLKEGQNVLDIHATSGEVKLNEKRTVTYVPAKP